MLPRPVYRVRITLGVASILFCQLLASYAGAAEPCRSILGEWGWFLGGKVNFSQDAQARWTPGAAAIPPASGTWKCDPRSGAYTVNWQNGFVDTLRLSDDGAQLSGTSSTGAKVWGKRISAAAGASPAPSTTRPTSNPAAGSDGWTPMGPGGFGRQAPTPGIPQRMGPQGRPPPKGAG